ncbi:MAG: hypothetical protein ACPH3M_07895, partial [Candidatus Puniceispirillales bacterium]
MVSSENNTFAPSQPDSRQEMDQKIPVDAPADDPRHLLEALRWQVDIGADENLQIICGAPNVRQDLKVAVATVGTVLPN